MTLKEFHLRCKSRWWKRWMRVLDATCTEHTVSSTTDHLLDPNVDESAETRLSIEFRIYRHTYRYGQGVGGFTFQFNVSQVDCVRHSLDAQLKYQLIMFTQYGLSPEEYFYVVKQTVQRMGNKEDRPRRVYVKKRRFDR